MKGTKNTGEEREARLVEEAQYMLKGVNLSMIG